MCLKKFFFNHISNGCSYFSDLKYISSFLINTRARSHTHDKHSMCDYCKKIKIKKVKSLFLNVKRIQSAILNYSGIKQCWNHKAVFHYQTICIDIVWRSPKSTFPAFSSYSIYNTISYNIYAIMYKEYIIRYVLVMLSYEKKYQMYLRSLKHL